MKCEHPGCDAEATGSSARGWRCFAHSPLAMMVRESAAKDRRERIATAVFAQAVQHYVGTSILNDTDENTQVEMVGLTARQSVEAADALIAALDAPKEK